MGSDGCIVTGENLCGLVLVNNGAVFCDSQMVAEKFEHKHLYIIKTIEKLMTEYQSIKEELVEPLNFKKTEREYRGQKFKAYLMDRRAFSLLAMRFTGKRAFEWQVKFNDAFYAMESQLLKEKNNKKDTLWVEQRNQGKLIRLTAMDTVKNFVDYATTQGSQNSKFYYKHITNACYKCLQLIQLGKPNLRDTLDLLQLHQLMMAEIVAERSIRKHMDEGEHYKAIFTLVKKDLEAFADSLIIPYSNRISN
jgi:Rha family phage regulatory protein